MRPPKLNSIEPPRYGSVCQVVWEGRCREASPYPDLGLPLRGVPPRRASSRERPDVTLHIATRYDQLANSFLGMVHIATARYWLKFVHAA